MKLGFVDYYLDEWHALNYPKWIKERSNGTIEVAYATAISEGEVHGKRANRDVAEELGLEWVEDIEILVEKSDGVILLSPDNPEQHEGLAKRVFAGGKPVYLDKTFAPDLATAKRMVDLADAHGIPMYSTSALRYAQSYVQLKDTPLAALHTRGPNTVENYGIHQIEPFVMLMGSDVSEVLMFGPPQYPSFVVRLSDGRTGSMTFTGSDLPFVALAIPEDGPPHTLEMSDNFFEPFIDQMLQFFETKDVPVDHAQTCANIAVLEALSRARDHAGQWISVAH